MAKKKGKRRGRPLWQDLLFLLGFFIGALVYLYPTISDTWNYYRDQKLIADYTKAVEQMDDHTYDEYWRTAREYNAQHTVNVIMDAFKNEDYVLTHPYDTILNPTGNEIMGYIDIPKINVQLSIYHGVGADALEKGVGHIEGTSLPIGGKGTHAVLSAHRGLPGALLFTDLDQLVQGDMFYITILGERMAYEVDQIEVVEPTDPKVSELIAIEKDKDLVTLITCTPYAVNTHRMLVRGHRTELEEVIEEDNSVVDDIQDNSYREELNRQRIIKILIVAGFFVLIIIIWIVVRFRRR